MTEFLRVDMGAMSYISLDGNDTLYLGTIFNAIELSESLNKRAWAILNCTDDPALDHLKVEQGFEMLRLNQWDGEPYPGLLVKVGIEFIRQNIEANSAVLVCCHAGMSRSPGMVVAYLMYRYLESRKLGGRLPTTELRQEAYLQAIKKVRNHRPIIQIHPQIDLSIRQYFGLAPRSAEDLIG